MGLRYKGREISIEEAAQLGLPGGYVDLETLKKLQEAPRSSAPAEQLEAPPLEADRPPPPPADERGKVLPFAPRPTLGDLLGVAPPAAAAAPQVDQPGPALVPPPIGPSPEVQTFAGFASKTITAVGVSVIGGVIRRKRREPNEPDEDVIDRVNELQTQLIAERIGNQQIPTWAILVTAWGQLGLSMAMGAKPIEGASAGEPSDARAEGAPPAPSPAGKVVFGAPPPLR